MIGLLVALCAVAGAALGWRGVLPAPYLARLDALAEIFLGVVLLGVGVEIGRSRGAWVALRRLGLRVLLIPACVAAGSLLGGAVAAPLLGMPVRETAAVSAGFGWYSFSAVLLTRLHSAELGALAFLANIARELLAIAAIPIVARRLGRAAAIAPGGATTMDVTLPVVVRSAGPESALPAFLSGLALSLLVPLCVALALRL